ncbi:MAG: acyl--CoA ligase [Deltaproteobacteria bacterium]|nr:acyl--CoA ligase [Deltaproteobacteria bacterium]
MAAITEINDEVRERLIKELTAPGAMFEVTDEVIRGIEYKVFKSSPRNLKEVYAQGIDEDSFHAKIITQWFGRHDWPFMVYADEQYTFKQTYHLAAQLAWRMKENYNIEKGDRVAIAMRNYPEFCLAFMAATALGALAVPLNAWWEGTELAFGLENSESKLIFADHERAQRMAPFLKDLNIPLVVARPESALFRGSVAYEDLVAGSIETEFPLVDVEIDDDAYIMYTSGSTGRPKGVVTTHRAVISTLMSWIFGPLGMLYLNRDYLDEVKPDYRSSSLLTVPLFHVTGLLAQFLVSFVTKRKMVMMYKWDPEEALRLIEKERITAFTGVPSMSWELANAPSFSQYDTSSLIFLGGGGAARPPHQVGQLEKMMGRHISQAGYGLTETAAVGTGNDGDNYTARPDSVGRPTPPLVQAKIVDALGNDLNPGEIGEICFKTPSNLRCYWKDPKSTEDIFLEDGWLKTGDIGLMDQDDFIYIKDRAKDIIIRGGENIACREVEDAIYEHPSVFEAVVFGLPEERLGECVAAVVMRRKDERLDSDELKNFLSGRLAKFKIPSLIWIQDDPLPRGGTGKMSKKDLREEKIKELKQGSV